MNFNFFQAEVEGILKEEIGHLSFIEERQEKMDSLENQNNSATKKYLEAASNKMIKKQEVHQVVMDKNIRRFLCPVLRSLGNDAFEIAKVASPILVSLSVTGVIALPITPIAVAGLSIVLARMGIVSYCANEINLTEKEK